MVDPFEHARFVAVRLTADDGDHAATTTTTPATSATFRFGGTFANVSSGKR